MWTHILGNIVNVTVMLVLFQWLYLTYWFCFLLITLVSTSFSFLLICVSLLSTLVSLLFYLLPLSNCIPNTPHTHSFSPSSLWPSLSFSSPHSPSVCVCWIDCTSGYIFCPHFCSLPLASPSHSSLECRPTVGYYCLIKGRLGRRRPDKSIKLPLAVPEGRWIEMDFVPAREYPRVHLFQMVSEDVYAEAARWLQQ